MFCLIVCFSDFFFFFFKGVYKLYKINLDLLLLCRLLHACMRGSRIFFRDCRKESVGGFKGYHLSLPGVWGSEAFFGYFYDVNLKQK